MPESFESVAICHVCGAAMDVAEVAPFTKVVCPGCGEESRVKCEFGPYTLVRRHAVGGMSMVFAAEDHTLHREVALKILSEEFSANETRIAAFEEEARITASFNHPNVVRVLRTGRAFGRFYIAMELVPGGHFEHQIRERGKIPEIELLPLAVEVAHGLQAAHAAGLIHRDVKPGNILLDATGHAKLVDFGLALVTQGGKAQATEVWATPYYVPPETVEGTAEDFRSDIYAFGATLYHALCGLPSCGQETMATDKLREAKKKVLPLRLRDPSISPATSQLVERAMAYNPEARFESYDELIEALNAAWTQVRSGRSEPLDTNALRRAEKKRKLRRAVVAALLGLVVVAGAVWWRRSRPAPVPPPVVEVVAKPPVVEIDTSGAIMKSYREGRAAVVARDFKKAGEEFLRLHQNPAVHEPTRSWAGVEAVLAGFLDGHPPAARANAAITLKHLRALPEANNPFGPELIETLSQLEQLPPLTPPTLQTPVASASSVLATMVAGLKNWEQGMMDRAAACFSATVSAKLSQDEQWAEAYQHIASDYLVDYQLLSSALFGKQPTSKADCDAAIKQLEEALPKLKTRGRAHFNVRAWQLDLAKTAKRMELSVAP